MTISQDRDIQLASRSQDLRVSGIAPCYRGVPTPFATIPALRDSKKSRAGEKNYRCPVTQNWYDTPAEYANGRKSTVVVSTFAPTATTLLLTSILAMLANRLQSLLIV